MCCIFFNIFFLMWSPKKYAECAKFLSNQIPFNLWPAKVRGMFVSKDFLTYAQRMTMVCFLYGNGCPNDYIHVLLHKRLRDKAAFTHVGSLISSIESKKFDHLWYYYNVHIGDYLFLNGSVAPQQQSFSRMYVLWDKHCHKIWCNENRYPTMEEETKFFKNDL